VNQISPNPEIIDRYYQIEAATSVMAYLEVPGKRQVMVAMAPGTGKTRLGVSVVDMFLRAKWVSRVLYLVDHIILVEQVKRVFNQYLPDIPVSNVLDKGQIVCTTNITLLDQINGADNAFLDNSDMGCFDLIIVDGVVCGQQKYKIIFDYFDSLLLALTTVPCGQPEEKIGQIFGLENQQPIYEYDLAKAIRDGFVVPPSVISVPHQFPRKDLNITVQVDEEYAEKFDDLALDAVLSNWLFNEENICKALTHLMENGLKAKGDNRLGKTLIFALSAKHAEFIVEQFKQCFAFLPGEFCCQINDLSPESQRVINDFQLSDQYPQIIVSAGLFDAGVNIPALLNLVFLKSVHTQEKLWQMIGRGMRPCTDLLGPGISKKEFLIFDYCQNLESLGVSLQGYEVPRQESLTQRILNRRLELIVASSNNELGDESLQVFNNNLKDQMHWVMVKLNERNFIDLKQYGVVERFVERESWDYLTEEDIAAVSTMLMNSSDILEENESTRRFDLLVLDLQTEILKLSHFQALQQKSLRKIAADLGSDNKIPKVAEQIELIRDLQTDGWWQHVTIPILENVRLSLRTLIMVKAAKYEFFNQFDMPESVGNLPQQYVDTLMQPDPGINQYRLRVERFIQEHQNHMTIHRLKDNERITQSDLEGLEEIIFEREFVISRDIYEQVYGAKPLGVLVRETVGLSRSAANHAFTEFLQHTQLNSEQTHFIHEVIKYFVRNGVMPIVDLHSLGLDEVLDEQKAQQVTKIVQAINENAEGIY